MQHQVKVGKEHRTGGKKNKQPKTKTGTQWWFRGRADNKEQQKTIAATPPYFYVRGKNPRLGKSAITPLKQ